jgi:cytochrome b
MAMGASPSPSPALPWAGRLRIGYLLAAWLFVISVGFQVFLAGIALFVNLDDWSNHITFGHIVPGLVALVMLPLAYWGRLGTSTVRWTALLFGLVLVQTEVFAVIKTSLPLVAALHPVNALIIFALGVALARRARASASTDAAGTDAAGAAVGGS